MGKDYRTATTRQRAAWAERALARILPTADYTGHIETHHGDRIVADRRARRAYSVADLKRAHGIDR